MKKILIGGSPCTHWSIAQKNNRETTAEGIGWELFKNYLIAKEKFQPDYFLYENNKSAAQPIKDQISIELGVPLQYINSALVSAQNRQRFYAHNIQGVPQPEDRGILLRDILETGEAWKEKSYTLDANYYKTAGTYNPKSQHSYSRHMAAEPVGITADGKAYCLTSTYYKGPMLENTLERGQRSMIAEPVAGRIVGRRINEQGHRDDYNENIEHIQRYEVNENPQKTNAVTTVTKDNMIAEPIRIGTIGSEAQSNRIYSPNGKSVSICGQGGGAGAKTGLYACLVDRNGKQQPVYEVRNGLITIKDKQYPIKLADGYYIIRKLTVTECCRLQTLPDDYCRAVSNLQAYKGLGNGWTAEVIIHILRHMNIPRDEEIIVLSMYDGIATGRYCFDKLGYRNIRYYAYEIDKYAMQVANSNYPASIIQRGDAFQVRDENWAVG
ncbi:DNA cytosine methyltransferase [Ruminiclostridium josui]|uniref:DNA cytosine methyltransferase n=1 Tax=Ruminiclostridium josui TaxID=1499 RepID=UPI0004649926|nr:DNA cytosine methyltransferase [Ruminiclostridium josui]